MTLELFRKARTIQAALVAIRGGCRRNSPPPTPPSRQAHSAKCRFTRRFSRPFFSILPMRSRPISPVERTCVPPQGCRSRVSAAFADPHQPHPALADRRLHLHRLHHLRPRRELLLADPLGADRQVGGDVGVQPRLERRHVLGRLGHVEVEPALVLADRPAGHADRAAPPTAGAARCASASAGAAAPSRAPAAPPSPGAGSTASGATRCRMRPRSPSGCTVPVTASVAAVERRAGRCRRAGRPSSRRRSCGRARRPRDRRRAPRPRPRPDRRRRGREVRSSARLLAPFPYQHRGARSNAPLKTRGGRLPRPGRRGAARGGRDVGQGLDGGRLRGRREGVRADDPGRHDRRERREGAAAAARGPRPQRGGRGQRLARVGPPQRRARGRASSTATPSASPPTRRPAATTSRPSARPSRRRRPSPAVMAGTTGLRLTGLRRRRSIRFPNPERPARDRRQGPADHARAARELRYPAGRLRHPRQLRPVPDPDRRAVRLAARRLLDGDRHPEPRLGHRPADLRRHRRALRRPPGDRARRAALRRRAGALGLRRHPGRAPAPQRADRLRHRRHRLRGDPRDRRPRRLARAAVADPRHRHRRRLRRPGGRAAGRRGAARR